MKLPNAENAIIDKDKIENYCLNLEHPRGKHKARVFISVLGLTVKDSEYLIGRIKTMIIKVDCLKGEQDQYGQRYTADIEIKYESKKAVVRTSWIIKHPRGKHKARVFISVLGLTVKDSEYLIGRIKTMIIKVDCLKGEQDQYGQRYTADIEIKYESKKAVVRTSWIIKRNESNPRLTTCYVK